MPERKLLTDCSLEIPPFLQRNQDNSFKYANIALMTMPVSAPVTRDDERQLNRWGWPVNPADERAKREILASEAKTQAERSAEHGKVARAKRIAEQEQKAQQLMAGRKNFLQHFKWDL